MIGKLDGISPEYVAGYFDGEGSVTIVKVKPKRSTQNPYHSLYVHIGSVNPTPLILIKERWGGSLTPSQSPIPNRKLNWNWVLTANLAGRFLKDILPHLTIKSQQAEIGILIDESNKDNDFRRGNPITREVIAFREGLKLELNRLNKRGAK